MPKPPDFDPYAELGLGKDASEAEIRKAYRRRAAETHPDTKGGKRESFDLVVLAKDVLSDAGRRAKYDETGAIDDSDGGPDNTEGNARALIAQTINGIIDGDHPIDITRIDLMPIIVNHIEKLLQDNLAQLKTSRRKSDLAARMLKRFRRRKNAPGKNLMDQILQKRISDEKNRSGQIEKIIAIQRRALAIMTDYVFDTVGGDNQEQRIETMIQSFVATGRTSSWG